MAYPTYGTAGTELLYRTSINTLATSETAFRWDRTNATLGTSSYDVADHHIVTVLVATFCNNEATARNLSMKINDGQDIYLLHEHSIGGKNTFVWSDKFCLVAGDKLQVVGTGSNIDCHITYIDQAF